MPSDLGRKACSDIHLTSDRPEAGHSILSSAMREERAAQVLSNGSLQEVLEPPCTPHRPVRTVRVAPQAAEPISAVAL